MRSKKVLYIILGIVLLAIASVIYFNNYEKFYFVSIEDIKNEESKIKEKINDKIVVQEEIEDTLDKDNIEEKEESKEESTKKEIDIKVDKNKDTEVNNVVDNKEEVIEKIIQKKEETSIKEEEVINNTNNSDKDKEEVIENTGDTKPVTKTQEQINDEFRKTIENMYGVTIKYGNEMGDYKLRGYLPTKLLDPLEIYENLENIKEHITYYPVGFFKEMKDFGMPLTIYLVKNIPNSGIAGIADKEFYVTLK